MTEYSRGAALYFETSLVHRNRFYRIVLATTEAAFGAGKESYDAMVGSLAFIR